MSCMSGIISSKYTDQWSKKTAKVLEKPFRFDGGERYTMYVLNVTLRVIA